MEQTALGNIAEARTDRMDLVVGFWVWSRLTPSTFGCLELDLAEQPENNVR
jgi:hypothetical protein